MRDFLSTHGSRRNVERMVALDRRVGDVRAVK